VAHDMGVLNYNNDSCHEKGLQMISFHSTSKVDFF
jgi:hypothetical protein